MSLDSEGPQECTQRWWKLLKLREVAKHAVAIMFWDERDLSKKKKFLYERGFFIYFILGVTRQMASSMFFFFFIKFSGHRIVYDVVNAVEAKLFQLVF